MARCEKYEQRHAGIIYKVKKEQLPNFKYANVVMLEKAIHIYVLEIYTVF
jgi:hypothetical protein